jgi:hypothetical protein
MAKIWRAIAPAVVDFGQRLKLVPLSEVVPRSLNIYESFYLILAEDKHMIGKKERENSHQI